MAKFYITTPIYYVNDIASIGHAYTTIAADVLARYHRLLGESTFFLTGLDENSQKTIQGAKKAGIEDIKAYTDEMAEKWKNVFKKLNMSNDDFIRTTEERHKKNVEKFFKKVFAKGDIYKGKYEGLYCEGCEGFVKESELVNGLCPFHLKAPAKISEENYFFKLSKYRKQLLEIIKKDPKFFQPESRKNEVLSFIQQGLQDISISRPYNGWGIKLPIDESQVVWVWFDALVNYLLPKKFWPATLHLMGKDIIKFHFVIWPAMLLSAGEKLPKSLFAHGFMTINGQKMSKSLGNAIDPLYLSEKYSVDSLRYYLLREIPFGEDGDFSEKNLVARHNNELANELGNLLNRVLSLIEKNFQGKIPAGKTNAELQKKLDLKKIEKHFENLELHSALAEIFSFINACNKFVNDRQPWKQSGKELEETLYSVADSLRIISILLSPFIPETSEKINLQLGVKAGVWKGCKFNLLKADTQTKKGEVLFKKIEEKNSANQAG